MLILSENILAETPGIMLDPISEHFGAQSSWHVKLTIMRLDQFIILLSQILARFRLLTIEGAVALNPPSAGLLCTRFSQVYTEQQTCSWGRVRPARRNATPK